MSKAKLLVVEDDPNLGDILQEYLTMKGYETTLCRDGEEGWSKFKKDKYGLAILDIMMPKKRWIHPGQGNQKSPRRPSDHLPYSQKSQRRHH
jgi:CheY-like chemotaxis protein